MNYNDEMKKYALNLFDFCLDNNKLHEFVCGIAKLTARNQNGEEVHNYPLVMNTIYVKHLKNKNLNVDKKFYDAVLEIFKNCKSAYLLNNTLKCIEYHMLAEKQNVAPFKVELTELLEEAKNNLKKNKELYSNNSSWKMFQEHDRIINDNFGHKIL